MELTTIEVAVLETAVQKANEEQLQQLNDFQLALVGGGIADVVAG